MLRSDELDPLPYSAEMPSLMSAWGRVDIHSIAAKFLSDNRVRGAYLEFGVGAGRSAVTAIRAYTRADICDQFVLFDSFSGLPTPSGVDENSLQFKAGDYSHSRIEVIDFLSHYGVNAINVDFVEGWFENSLKKWFSQHQNIFAAVVHVDVDLYESCTHVLKNIVPAIHSGSIMLFDDWNCFKASSLHGEKRAVREWCILNPDVILHPFCSYGWHGQAFIVEKRE